MDFSEFCNEVFNLYRHNEFVTRIQAICSMRMYDFLCGEDAADEIASEKAFVKWLCVLLGEGKQPILAATQQQQSGSIEAKRVEFVSRDVVDNLYELFKVSKMTQKSDQQGFLDLLQRVAETQNLMPLTAEHLDNYVPLSVVKQFVLDLIQAYKNLMQQLSL
eukprot:Platyproteum_vivax@DN3725_c0_g1_i1.p1